MTHRTLRRWLVGLPVMLMAGTAAAEQPPMIDLSWEVPAECPQSQQVLEQLRAIAGAASERASRLSAEGEITKKDDGRFHLRLVVRDGELVGERNIVSNSCEDLAGAAAVSLGLLLRSELSLGEGELGSSASAESRPTGAPIAGTESTGPPPTPDTKSTEIIAQPARSRPSAAGHWRAMLRAPSLVSEIGLLPRASLGVSLGAGISNEHWRLLLAAKLWLKQTLDDRAWPDQGANVWRQTLELAIGRRFRTGHVELVPGFSGGLEHVNARGFGPGVTPIERSTSGFSAGADVLGVLHINETAAVFVQVGARFQTSEPVIAIDGRGDIGQLGQLVFSAATGVEWSF